MKTLLAVLLLLIGALVLYTSTQDRRALRIDRAEPADPDQAVPEKAVLKALVWRDYIPDDVYERLRIEQGIRIEQTTFTSDEEFLDRIGSGEHFDVALISDYIAQRLDRMGLSVDIDYSRIPNHVNLMAGLRQSEDMSPLVRCSVPFVFSTVALGYNSRQIDYLPLKWSALFDPKTPQLLRGRMAIIDDPRQSLGIALLALGKSPNSRDPAEVQEAGELIKRSMRHLVRLENYELAQNLIDEQLYLGMCWGGDIARAMDRKRHLRFVSPDEGSLLVFDCFVVLRDSAQRRIVEQFIDFMLRPEISARITNFSFFATVNEAATPYVIRSVRNGPAYYFPDGRHIHYRDDLGDAEQLYVDVWENVRAHYRREVQPTLDQELFFGGTFVESNDRGGASAPRIDEPPTKARLSASDPVLGR